MQIIFFIIGLLIVGAIIYAAFKKKPSLQVPNIFIVKQILEQHVLFYQQLSSADKVQFEQRLQNFLNKVRITGIKVPVEDMDRVFIAAAAIIPIFAFPDWEYRNIHEVLLYPGTFNHDFQIEGQGRDVLGMVGNGPMQNIMILSQRDLRRGFLNHIDASNTAIHEFVHLIDKSDGDTDGFPMALLSHKYALPWLSRIHQEIQLIESGDSDINPYAALNEAEFLAVAAEYFFENPQQMQEKHPALYNLLKQLFRPGP
jgi:Mlc titration factor MtfA (ptsG expression regulator)